MVIGTSGDVGGSSSSVPLFFALLEALDRVSLRDGSRLSMARFLAGDAAGASSFEDRSLVREVFIVAALFASSSFLIIGSSFFTAGVASEKF